MIHGLHVDAATEQSFAFVESEDLAGGESSLWIPEFNEGGIPGFRKKFQRDTRIAITYPALERSRVGEWWANPAQRMHSHLVLKQAGGVFFVEGDQQGVVRGAF